MAFNLREMISSISKSGVAKPSHYEVVIIPPAFTNFLNDRTTDGVNQFTTAQAIKMRAAACDLPGRNIKTIQHAIGNFPLQNIGTGVSFGAEIAMSIVLSENMAERVFFEQWQEQVAQLGGRTRPGGLYTAQYYDKYVGSIDIHQYNQLNQRVYSIRLHKAYPNFINPVQLAYDSHDTYLALSVQITYQSWERTFFKR